MQLIEQDRLWPEKKRASTAQTYLSPLIEQGVKPFISNVDTTIMALEDKELLIPLTINQAEYDNSYICSPYSQYVSYGLDELEALVRPSTLPFMKGALCSLGGLLKAGQINKTVHINNWLLSTNLYPSLASQQIQAILATLIQRFPDHALLFRSVNETDTDLIHLLKESGFSLLFSRKVFMLDTKSSAPFKERHFKKDLKLLDSGGYEVVENDGWSPDDAPRIAALYRALNFEKHSKVNPLFTDKFVANCLKSGKLRFRGLKKEGIIHAVYGATLEQDTMVAPFFGYDTTLPEKEGLYRQLSALAVLEAKESGAILNQSGGAASFKTRRGAKSVLEYHAVYTAHLPRWRQAPWQTLKTIGNRIILPFVDKKKI